MIRLFEPKTPLYKKTGKVRTGDLRHEPLPVPISLPRGKSGKQRVRDPFHRRIIRKGDDRGDAVIQLGISWFSLSRGKTKPMDKDTLESIVKPPNPPLRIATSSSGIAPICFYLYMCCVWPIPTERKNLRREKEEG